MNHARASRWGITLLRMAIGWHFLYEGLSKWASPDWSAASYLTHAQGPFAGFYHWLGSSESLLGLVDAANVYGLIAIGLALFFGVCIRAASAFGIVLLTLYYFAYPPFGATAMNTTEGSLFIVNRIFLEAVALLVVLLVKERGFGLYAIRFGAQPKEELEVEGMSRRASFVNLLAVPTLGVLGWGAQQQKKKYDVDAMSGATIKVDALDITELEGELPKGKIGPHEIGRLVLGGNMIGGWMHARDLLYVSTLSKAYNTEEKVFETLQLAEQAGINAINIGFPSNAIMKKYKDVTGSEIKVISQVAPTKDGDYLLHIDQAIDLGADILQVQGNWCDWLVRDGKMDGIAKMLEHIRRQNYVAGLGAHTVDSLIACREEGVIPDYYMKTMHHDNYWSAHPRENRKPFEVDGKNSPDHDQFHNNCFCPFPEKTIEFVKNAEVPVMGYKVLAAGAIGPENGFKWAFMNGADFICVGMFDFQVVKNVNTAIKTLRSVKDRQRSWYA